jgi:hypothetical protein
MQDTYVSTYILSDDFDYVKLLSIIHDRIFFPGSDKQISNLIEEIRSSEELKRRDVNELQKIWRPLDHRINPITNEVYRRRLWDTAWITTVNTRRGPRVNQIDVMIVNAVMRLAQIAPDELRGKSMGFIMRLRNILDVCSLMNLSYSTVAPLELDGLVSLLEDVTYFWMTPPKIDDFPELKEVNGLIGPSSKLVQDFSPIIKDFVDLELPDFREFSWEEVLDLRRSSDSKAFREWLAHRHNALVRKQEAKWSEYHEILEALWECAKEITPNPSKTAIKGVASNLPVPVIGVNPLGIGFSISEIRKSIVRKRKHGWLFFLVEMRGLKDRESKVAKKSSKIRVVVDPFTLQRTYGDGSFITLPHDANSL